MTITLGRRSTVIILVIMLLLKIFLPIPWLWVFSPIWLPVAVFFQVMVLTALGMVKFKP